MCTIYLTGNSNVVGIDTGRVSIRNGEDIRTEPLELLDGINIYGKSQITTQCIQTCMRNNIPISFYTQYGQFIGGLYGTEKVNVARQRKQAFFSNKEAAFRLGKKIVYAKISNQITVLRRYSRHSGVDVSDYVANMDCCRRCINICENTSQIMGYEGAAAKEYFAALGKMVNSDFYFEKRSKHPPKDAFNSMLSFGYSLLYKEIYGIVVSRGLNPFFGFLHSDTEGHMALVSDLMEEWRSLIVDSLVMNMVNGNEIEIDNFDISVDGMCTIDKDGIRLILEKYNKKMNSTSKYNIDNEGITYRKMIGYQVMDLIHVMEEENPDLYNPIIIR